MNCSADDVVGISKTPESHRRRVTTTTKKNTNELSVWKGRSIHHFSWNSSLRTWQKQKNTYKFSSLTTPILEVFQRWSLIIWHQPKQGTIFFGKSLRFTPTFAACLILPNMGGSFNDPSSTPFVSKEVTLQLGPWLPRDGFKPWQSLVNYGEKACLVGGWTNPSWKICSSNWIISPIFGVKIKIFELPPTRCHYLSWYRISSTGMREK